MTRQKSPVDPNYLSTIQAANYLGVSESLLMLLNREGRGPIKTKIGARTFYYKADLDEYKLSCRVVPKPRGVKLPHEVTGVAEARQC
jgi:hypothetical protein